MFQNDAISLLPVDVSVHRNELIRVLNKVLSDTTLSRRKRFPTRYATAIWSALTGCDVDPWCAEPQGIKHSIRQIHDFYGWMAKPGKYGVCAGTIYRTENFMRMPLERRDGSKGPNRSVHIEHTVPVADLEKSLHYRRAEFETPIDLHWFLMCHSICVAFSHKEELALSIAKVPNLRNDSFDVRGRLAHKFPFRRYRRLAEYAEARGESFRILNVVQGTTIDLDQFSFDNHIDTLGAASRLVLDRERPSLYGLELFNNQY